MAKVVLMAEVVLVLLGSPMVVVARHHLHHIHHPRIQLAQDLRLSSPSSYLTPRRPSSMQRWHVLSLPAHPQPTSNSSQHYIEPYPAPQVMFCVCDREIVCTRVVGLVRTCVCVCVCVCAYGCACVHGLVHAWVGVHGTLVYVLGFVYFLRVQ